MWCTYLLRLIRCAHMAANPAITSQYIQRQPSGPNSTLQLMALCHFSRRVVPIADCTYRGISVSMFRNYPPWWACLSISVIWHLVIHRSNYRPFTWNKRNSYHWSNLYFHLQSGNPINQEFSWNKLVRVKIFIPGCTHKCIYPIKLRGPLLAGECRNSTSHIKRIVELSAVAEDTNNLKTSTECSKLRRLSPFLDGRSISCRWSPAW